MRVYLTDSLRLSLYIYNTAPTFFGPFSLSHTYSTSSPSMSALVLTDADHNKTVEVAAGQTVLIRLQGNPTTGYAWSVVGSGDAADFSNDQLSVHRTYQQDSAPPMMCGVGGHYEFTVSPKAKGTHPLHLVYSRSFQPESPDNKNFTVHIKAE